MTINKQPKTRVIATCLVWLMLCAACGSTDDGSAVDDDISSSGGTDTSPVSDDDEPPDEDEDGDGSLVGDDGEEAQDDHGPYDDAVFIDSFGFNPDDYRFDLLEQAGWPLGLDREPLGPPVAFFPVSDECSPDRDDGSGNSYTRLDILERRDPAEEDLVGLPFATALDFTNEKRQAFVITVAGEESQVEEYIAGTNMCVEQISLTNELPRATSGIPVIDMLLQELQGVLGIENLELVIQRDDLINQGVEANLAAVLEWLGFVPGDWQPAIDSTIVRIQDEYSIAVNDYGWDEDAIAELLDLYFAVPGAPYLFVGGIPPAQDDYTALGELSIVVTIEAADQSDEGHVVAFAVDPHLPKYAIDRGGYHYYRSKCSRSMRVRVRAFAGSVTARGWKYNPYEFFGSRWADAGLRPWSRNLYASRSGTTRYDAGVAGNINDSQYSLYGGWEKGFGTTC